LNSRTSVFFGCGIFVAVGGGLLILCGVGLLGLAFLTGSFNFGWDILAIVTGVLGLLGGGFICLISRMVSDRRTLDDAESKSTSKPNESGNPYQSPM
jgi:hypothetical protein